MNPDTSKIHLDILDSERIESLKKIIPMMNTFTLGGGTALALQVNHRKSFDFDFFSKDEISSRLLEKLSQIIDIKSTSINTNDELTFLTSDDIKFTFLFYPFDAVYTDTFKSNDLNIFSIKMIASQKAYTIGRRGAFRDYFDLFIILKGQYIDIKDLISSTEKIYGTLFNAKLFLKQLTYMDDIDDFTVIPIENRELPSIEEIKNFFNNIVNEVLNDPIFF